MKARVILLAVLLTGSGVIGPIMIAGARRDAEAESRRLYIMCMEAHGYTQAKAGGPYLGLNVRPDEQGLRINRIVTGGPAEAAGLLVDDVIRESDGRRVTGLNDFYATLDAKMPGDQMTLLVLRAGAAREVTVTVGRRP
jgi:S1-C subfamily serine protease